ncbi:MAG: ABC transporter permease [Chloroflexota bacterium]|nr:ABC transporter permease [Chloroflexota bacterium]MDE2857691.1 ABC transporter permease [Chloroflexota bacterium]MDE2950805.1 ABC transporter permease [Chloroflexota bacterium]
MKRLGGGERPTGLYELAILKFVRNRVAVLSLVCLALILLAVLFADVVTPYDPIERNTPERNLGPSLAHPFGTDKLGRDIMSRVLYGGRVSLQVGFLSIALSTLVSVPLGLIGGFVGGLVDDFIMRVMDLILAFPGLILAIWLVSLLGSNMTNVIFAIAFFSLPTYARLIRGITLSIREMEYVMAARSMGAGSPRIMFFHVLPGVLGPLIVLTTLGVSGAIVTGASLSFLGLGVSPPTPEWGAMLADGRNYMRTQWWIAVFPGITITLVVLILNIIGDALRDALDPNVRA